MFHGIILSHNEKQKLSDSDLRSPLFHLSNVTIETKQEKLIYVVVTIKGKEHKLCALQKNKIDNFGTELYFRLD